MPADAVEGVIWSLLTDNGGLRLHLYSAAARSRIWLSPCRRPIAHFARDRPSWWSRECACAPLCSPAHRPSSLWHFPSSVRLDAFSFCPCLGRGQAPSSTQLRLTLRGCAYFDPPDFKPR